jgi:hypothetical protein
VAQLDLFGVSRRFPSIRHLNNKEKKKMKQQEKKGQKSADNKNSKDNNSRSRAGISLAVTGQLYSLPAKKSAPLHENSIIAANSSSHQVEATGNCVSDTSNPPLKSDGESDNLKPTDISLKGHCHKKILLQKYVGTSLKGTVQ